MNRYTVSSLIGEGSFGRVYKATRKDDAQIVAIKIISKRGRSPKDLRNLRRECEIQAQLKHQNVIEMLESFETRSELVVVTEFAMIDLHRYMSLHGAFSEAAAQHLICNLVSALYYLHSHRILHRDLKPQNVLLNDDMQAKLCDFGLARNMTTRTHVLTSIKGTPLYMAPELLAERPYDHQADLWSLGCIAYESLAGQPPFCTTSILHLVKMIKHEEIKWPSFLSSDCRSFLQGLLEKDPSLRASWAQLLCHPFVDGKLFISGIKADNSPFTNPQPQPKKPKADARTTSDNMEALISNTQMLSIEANADNVSSSRDSINAIPPSDIENIETDLEDNINNVEVPFADSISSSRDANKPPYTQLMAEGGGVAPMINSQTCFVSGNNNMVLLNFNDNFEMNSHTHLSNSGNAITVNGDANVKKSRNKDLERRKLSQNLDNFSLRLGQSIDAEHQRKCVVENREKDRCKDANKAAQTTLKSSTQSNDEKQSSNNSPPCLLPGWDSCDETQSPPIENDEWLAFLHRSMQEILDGEWDSLRQQNLVSIIVAPLRNSKAIPKVIESVAQLLSMPFALNESSSIMDAIKTVYIEVKLVPNLMYATKLLMCQRDSNSAHNSAASGQLSHMNRAIRPLSGLSDEEIRTASHLYELVCHLVHLRQQFLSQFCDAVAILAANDLLINFLNHDYKNAHAVRISCCVLALFCCVLCELPENAELVEKVIFNAKLNVVALLENAHDLLRARMCMLLRLLTRFSLRGLQTIWCRNMKRAIENLADDDNDEIRELAESTLEELRQFAFYA